MPIKPIIAIIFIIIAISVFSAGAFYDFNFKAIASIFKMDEEISSENKLENKVLGDSIASRDIKFCVPVESTNKNYPSLPLEKSEIIKNPKPIRNLEIHEIDINAKAAIVMDATTGEILYNKNIDEKLPIASLTKLMTALVILDETNLNNIVVVSKDAIDTEGEKGSLEPGEKITVKNLLYALLVSSSNDSAIALAEYVSNNLRWFHSPESLPVRQAGQWNQSVKIHTTAPQGFAIMEPAIKTESIFKFIELMNQKAIFLELENTNFSSPSGLDRKENYSTAYDLALLAKFVLDKPLIWEMLRTQEIKISSSNGKIIHNLKNTNKLLGKFLNIAGGKTGFTDEAGECLLLVAGDPIKNHQIISIVLNAQDRFSETEKLIQWTFDEYSWK